MSATATATLRHAFFLPTDDGQRLCVFYPAVGPARGRVLHIAPFAEEMNKSRRMAALQSRAFAAHGFAVMQIDMHGCGDSSGDFGDASWARWLDDLQLAHAWLAERAQGPDWLWGVRAGCLLATELGARLAKPIAYLFWQPPASGKQLLQQFLRLRTVGEALEGSAPGKRGTDALKLKLQQGMPVEVAGYMLSPELACGLEAGTVEPPAKAQRLAAFELSTRDDAEPSPVLSRLVTAWHTAGAASEAHVVSGPAFWQTTEIEDAPALLAASLEAVQRD